VYDKLGNYITSIGDRRYGDYSTFLESHGLEYANRRKHFYYMRHQKDTGIRGQLAKYILW
jgi:hypothetical protein